MRSDLPTFPQQPSSSSSLLAALQGRKSSVMRDLDSSSRRLLYQPGKPREAAKIAVFPGISCNLFPEESFSSLNKVFGQQQTRPGERAGKKDLTKKSSQPFLSLSLSFSLSLFLSFSLSLSLSLCPPDGFYHSLFTFFLSSQLVLRRKETRQYRRRRWEVSGFMAITFCRRP
jgi:hypothetical protein